MRIIGIDPGTTCTGIGIVDSDRRGECSPVFFTALRFKSRDLSIILPDFFNRLNEILDTHKPGAAAIEDIFTGVNVKSTVKLAHLRGTAITALGLKEIPVAAYAPRSVKKTIAGHGQADKEQLRFLVETQLRIKLGKAPLDVSDALAIALCHAQHLVFGN